MTVERSLRLMAGAFVLISLALGYWVSPYWFLFTAFVGANLLQSGFTNWCPAMAIFRKLGLPDAKASQTTCELNAVGQPGTK
ncbi:MAG TPA: DUF2892 domain-containing protein [Candidatus Angelobacter sp.]|nr:DUF2892 domain-containing protein [Candidatus Angelobacter sp.]